MSDVDLRTWPYLGKYTHPMQKPTREILGREHEMDTINAALHRPELCNVMLIAEAGAGKALANDTPIPVLDSGRLYKPISEIKVGDTVFDERGLSCRVKGVYPQGRIAAYRVIFEDGSIIVCNDSHIWRVRYETDADFRDMTLSEMLRKSARRGVFYVPVNGALQKPFTGIFCDIRQQGYDCIDVFKGTLMTEESIESEYFDILNGSIQQRQAFLHGILMRLGYYGNKEPWPPYYVDCSTMFLFARFVKELMDSLGIRTRLVKTAEDTYSLYVLNIADLRICLPLPGVPIGAVMSHRPTEQLRIDKIERLDEDVDMTCIYVDSPSHLFQAGKCHIVTHNTAVVQGLMMKDKERLYLEVDLAKMIADLRDSNEMANRLKQLFDEAQSYREQTGRELVLFIDEFHQIVQLSAAAVEALKPILADSGVRGIRVIAATTTEEFIQWIRPNLPLQERLQRINLPVVDEETTIAILRKMSETYGVDDQFYNDYMFHKIYEYTNRYIPASVQPRKSLKVLDAMIGWYRSQNKPLDEKLLAEVIQESENVKVDFVVDAVNIKKRLDEKVLAQDYATEVLSRRLQVCSAGLNEPNRPMGTFLFTGSTGVGKDLWDETPIPVYNQAEPVKRNGDLMVGDYVFNREGKPVQVTGVFKQGKKRLYCVTLADGRTLYTGREHLWSYSNVGGKGGTYWRTATTEDLMLKLQSNKGRYVIPMNKPVQYDKRKYRISPYNRGMELAAKNSREIPAEYMYGSIEQRWDLIRGIFDVGGVVAKPDRLNLTFTSSSETFIKNLASVIYSLGVSCTIKSAVKGVSSGDNKVSNAYKHTVEVKCSAADKLRFFTRQDALQTISEGVKRDNARINKKHYDVIMIKSIRELDFEYDTTCIMVDDEEHLYQAGDYVVTHNTEMTKQLAKILFDDERALIRFDMTEYANADSMERFRKELTDRVWARPYSIVLLDEIEKANGAVTRILLPVIDDGRLIDSNNREVTFKNSYLIFTTNAGNEIYKTISQYNASDEGSAAIINRYIKLIRRSLSDATGENKFPPELLGRIGDNIVPFQPLSEATQKQIVRNRIADMQNRIMNLHGVRVAIDKKVVQYLVEDMLDTQADSGGARAVLSKLNTEILPEIAGYILAHPNTRKIGVKVMGEMMSDNKNKLESDAYIKIVPLSSVHGQQM